MRKTKIVCTIGPASESESMLRQMIKSGMNVARLNFSHGDWEEHGLRIERIKQARKELNSTIGILLDTKGPEIRLGTFVEGSVLLLPETYITLTTEQVEGTVDRVSVTYADLPSAVSPGSVILLDDGLIELQVETITNKEVRCQIINGGTLKNRKGVNLPGVRTTLPGITAKDSADIVFGLKQGVDFIAASFVRKASDVMEIRELLETHNCRHVQIIAKIENQEGVDNLDEILEVSDGLMVARGDLGVEIPVEEVPLVQKQMIHKCNVVGKPVITATQMLDSMERNPRPTRAEASDVANAIFDGTDAIMLSGETAAGKYPLESVRTMSRIAEKAESGLDHRGLLKRQVEVQKPTVTEAISQAVVFSSLDLDVTAIVTATESGFTARMISKYRPKAPILAITPNENVMHRLSLAWGVESIHSIAAKTTDEMFDITVESALRSEMVQNGDLIIITAGVPVAQSGTTNLIKIHHVGELLASGQGIGTQHTNGKIVLAKTPEEANAKVRDGDILVCISTDKAYIPAMERAAAILTETGGITSHAAVVGISLGKPVIVGIEDIMNAFEDGVNVTINAEAGVVYSGRAKVL